MNGRRRAVGACLALLSLTCLAAWPILRAGYPSIGDGLNHLYRLVEFDHLLRGGVWFPRWATDLGYGYGYPLFNFYPPLVYYLGALFHALGLSYASSLLAIYGLAFALAVAGVYLLAGERWGETGGLIAACAYGLAPYLYFNVLARGALPETWALGLLPWALWAYVRLARRPGAAIFVTATLLYAALFLSHLLSALLAAPVLFVLAFASVFSPSASSAPRHMSFAIRHLLWVISSFVISLCLSAHFVVPALLETRHVQIHQLTTPGDLDFHNHFLSLSQLFALPRTFDPRLVFSPVPPSLSLVALALAGVGFASPLIRRLPFVTRSNHSPSTARRPLLGSWELGIGICFLLFCFFTLPLTTLFWERLPFAHVVQFPWRLVGPASLLLALLAASAAPLLEGHLSLAICHWTFANRHFVLALLLIAFFLYSLTWTFVPPFHAPAGPTVRDLSAYEAAGQLGTTSAGEFLPKEVLELPGPDSLRARYAEKTIIDRLAALPEGVTLVSQSATLTSASATVEAASPAILTFNFFHFPGWRATVDGQPVEIAPSTPHGLVTVPIRSGRHTIFVRFGPTPLRTAAAALSLAAILVLAIVAYAFASRAHPQSRAPAPSPARPHSVARSPAHLVTLTAIALVLVRLTLIDGRDTIFARSRFDGATVSGVGRTLDVNFDDQLVLIGLDLPQSALAADAALPLALYWRAQNPPRADYSTTLRIVDEEGNLFGQSDSQHPGRLPTTRWRLDQYARDEHRLTLLPGTPPGMYWLTVGVYPFGGAALNVLDENHIPQGQAHVLGPLAITRAVRPPARIDAAQRLDLALGPLTLLGVSLDTTTPLAGDELRLTLFWRADSGARPDLSLRLELTAPDGALIASRETSPARADHPTSAWAPGEVLRAPLRFRIPASAPAGPAHLRLSLLAESGARVAGPTVIADLDLRLPDRSFSLPAISHPRDDDFGGLVKFLGYDLAPNEVTLYWQALAPMDSSYAVFVHALDADDRILAQVDSVPRNGARPTTGWLPGEVLADPYGLEWEGAAKIEIGLYEPRSGDRLGSVVIQP